MIEQLKAYQAWRRGEDTRKLSETDLTPTVIGEAIDWAIEQLEGSKSMVVKLPEGDGDEFGWLVSLADVEDALDAAGVRYE